MPITCRGIYDRKGVKEYAHWVNTLPRDRVVKDEVLSRALAKIGYEAEFEPASYFEVEQLWEALNRYDGESHLTNDKLKSDSIAIRAIKRTYAQFANKGKKLKPLEEEYEIYRVIKHDSSAGLPYLSKKAEAFPLAWSRYIDVIEGRKAFNPCLAQFRTQRVNKTRLVWAYPLDATIAESCFAYPLIEYYKSTTTPMTLGEYKHQIGARIQNGEGKYTYQLDYSKFDSSISKSLIQMAFNIFKTHFDMTDNEFQKYKKIIKYFIHTPIVMPDAKLYVGKEKGVPSGSYFTNLVDSVVNYFLIEYINIKHRMSVPRESILVMGDDSIFTSNVKVSLDAIKATLSSLGIEVNTSKSKVSGDKDSVHYVGFEWHGGMPNKPLKDVLVSLVYPERYRKFKNRDEHIQTMLTQAALLCKDAFVLLQKFYPNTPFRQLILNAPGKGGYLSGYSEYFAKYVQPQGTYTNFTIGGHYLL